MTHEELLAKIDSLSEDWPGDGKSKTAIALRAVVELHKPAFNNKEFPNNTCMPCWVEYPCPTIQAIEKELK